MPFCVAIIELVPGENQHRPILIFVVHDLNVVKRLAEVSAIAANELQASPVRIAFEHLTVAAFAIGPIIDAPYLPDHVLDRNEAQDLVLQP